MTPLPSQQTPLVAGEGYMATAWRRFMEDVYNRFGASQDIKIRATSNTALQFSYKGTDGVVRTGTITLS